jgi:L,D-peptidoglycan transpeptidase YkuD (ErfK/YbiS/YcfS/YnhG family)
VRTRLGVAGALLALAAVSVPPATAATAPVRPSDLSLGTGVHQLITVTSSRWSATRATLYAWQKRSDGWHRVRGPVTVRLGWNGFVQAAQRRQGSGTTPAGKFSLTRAFGHRADPGTRLAYRHVDSNDVWPYEPRDPATYNILQPFQASSSHWRSDFRERLASYGVQYAYAVVIGFNLPHGVHWSKARRQYVATHRADTRRGGGIFLHVQHSTNTAGCVAGPLSDIRWLTRWLAPGQQPRIVMGPAAWVRQHE